MKKMVNKLKLLLVISMITIPVILMAQGDLPPDAGGDENGVTDAPFDGGVSLLIAAGIGYGLKRVYDNKRAEKEEVL